MAAGPHPPTPAAPGPPRLWLGAVLLLYIVSLALPAVAFGEDPPTRGAALLFFGAYFHPLSFLANPALWAGWGFAGARRWRTGLAFGALAVALALTPLQHYHPRARRTAEARARGTPMRVDEWSDVVTLLLPGYYCWLGSAVLLTVGCAAEVLAGARGRRDRPPGDAAPPGLPGPPTHR
jgi:hypothetical protein